jgi:hypothetical protein
LERWRALEDFLCQKLDDDLYSELFVDALAEILQDRLPEKTAQMLARACARNEREALDKVNKLLLCIHQHTSKIRDLHGT